MAILNCLNRERKYLFESRNSTVFKSFVTGHFFCIDSRIGWHACKILNFISKELSINFVVPKAIIRI
jgi:hypothetical protein